MSKQVLDIEQMKHLQELGIDTSNASAVWYKPDGDTEYFHVFDIAMPGKEELLGNEDCIPSYTLQDILDLLPISVNWNRLFITFDSCGTTIQYAVDEYSKPIAFFRSEQMIDAAYEMLCWCIGNGHVKTGKEGRK